MESEDRKHWFVMRDLKRANAKHPAYRQLSDGGFEVFVPKEQRLVTRNGVRTCEEVPFIRDLLFVRDSRSNLDPVVERIPTLQYRWLRNTYRMPMTVDDAEMSRFMLAVSTSTAPRYYLSEEITPQMCGRRIHIIGGPLHDYEGSLITVRGSRVKRLLVELKGFLAVGVEVNPEYIRLV